TAPLDVISFVTYSNLTRVVSNGYFSFIVRVAEKDLIISKTRYTFCGTWISTALPQYNWHTGNIIPPQLTTRTK
ncbi:MAG TPA: hypothetical protein VIJ25_08625, partial [Methylococcales bacterium]